MRPRGSLAARPVRKVQSRPSAVRPAAAQVPVAALREKMAAKGQGVAVKPGRAVRPPKAPPNLVIGRNPAAAINLAPVAADKPEAEALDRAAVRQREKTGRNKT